MKLWEDPRVARGMRVQLDLRRQRLAGGDKSLGWKVGFGAPAMLKQLGISGPLVGFLTQNARVQSGGSVSLAGWANPVAEPEIAVHIGRDVPAGADRDTAAAAIAGISPAIELVDVHTPPQDPERILGENIYQRHVVLAGAGTARAGANPDGLTCRIIRQAKSPRAPAIRRPIPGSGSRSCATSRMCWPHSASACGPAKSSSPGRSYRRSRSSRARPPSRSRWIRSAALR